MPPGLFKSFLLGCPMNPELFLFTVDPILARQAIKAGIDSFIIDWEDRARFDRQHTPSLTCNPDSVSDLRAMAQFRTIFRVCRINQFGEWTEAEVETAIKVGATCLFLPMVETQHEVKQFLSMVDGRVKAGIFIETVSACERADDLAKMPLDMVYVGLLDLAVCRGSKNLFLPFADGLLMRLRDTFTGTFFGAGGLTTVDSGAPVPCLELMAELVRIRCDFVFLRNSFKGDIANKNMTGEVKKIFDHWQILMQRSPAQVEQDHQRFVKLYVQESV